MSRELFSIEAEHGILGALLLDGSLFDSITEKVHVGDFHDLENAALYQVMIDCHGTGQPIDPVTLADFRHSLPSGVSVLEMAVDLARNVPSTANWATYAKTVRERAVLRRVVDAANVVRSMATENLPLGDVIAGAQQAMADLRDLDDSSVGYRRMSDVLPAVIDGVDARFNRVAKPKLSTGLIDLDKLLGGGLRQKTMVVIAGRPGSGKTTLGLQIAQHVAVSGAGVGMVFSLEMTEEELVTRSLASIGGVDLRRLDDGHTLKDDDWVGITAAVNKINHAEIYLNDQPGLTVARIRAISRRLQRDKGLDVLVVDYIGLIAGDGPNRTERIAGISTALKNLSKELGIPIIVLAQLNRESTKRPGKKPQASDLRDSGQIEQDADAVLLVHRDNDTEEGQNGVTELILDKGRQSQVGSCIVQQQGQFARFVNFAGCREVSQEEVEMGRNFHGQRGGDF
ncbi:Replicative DNA helicase [compost metagenome]